MLLLFAYTASFFAKENHSCAMGHARCTDVGDLFLFLVVLTMLNGLERNCANLLVAEPDHCLNNPSRAEVRKAAFYGTKESKYTIFLTKWFLIRA